MLRRPDLGLLPSALIRKDSPISSILILGLGAVNQADVAFPLASQAIQWLAIALGVKDAL
jgi:hypothetical protein